MQPELPTIVVVDDAAEVRVLVRTRIRVSGRLTLVAEGSDGAEAVALARRYRPDLMLLDVSMPGMDGLAALPDVLAVSPTTKVVLFSGFEEEGLVERARQLGAAAFIMKSVHVEELVDRLLGVLDQDQESGATTSLPAPPWRPDLAARVDQGVLAEHLERFREVFDEAAIGMATMTLAGSLVRANRALADLVGRRPEDLVGVDYAALTEGEAADVAAALDEIRRSQVDVVHIEHGVQRFVAEAAGARHPGAGPGLGRAGALRLPPAAGRHGGASRARGAAQERGAFPAPGGDRAGLRDLHARPDGPRRELERRCAAQQGLHRRRDHRPPLPRVLPRGAPGPPPPRARARDRPPRRSLRGGGLAGPQGRHHVLGQRRHHRRLRRLAAGTWGSPR